MTTPPKLALRFFRWFCHPDYVEDIEGDLLERFEDKVKRQGVKIAKAYFFNRGTKALSPIPDEAF